MDAGDHYLLMPVFHEGPDLFYHIIGLSAPCSSPGKRYRAVAAELIASVLDLHIGSGPGGSAYKSCILILGGLV